MALDVSELKQAFAKNMGDQFEAQLKATEAEIYRLEGGAGALLQAVSKLEELKTYYHKDAEEKKISEEVYVAVIKGIDQCEGSLRSLAEVAKTQKLIKGGEYNALTNNVSMCKKIIQTEADRARALLDAMEKGDVRVEPDEAGGNVARLGRRPTGMHPGKNLAQRRRSKAAKEDTAEAKSDDGQNAG